MRRFYTLIVACTLLALMFWLGLVAAFPQEPKPETKQPSPPVKPTEPEAEPPEEDATAKPKEYSFNPLQAANEIKVGMFYMKRGRFKAGMMRFDEATKWDPGSADAWLKLGEAREKLKDQKGMKEAYEKYLELAPSAKDADAIRKKVGKS
jgi:eukaryotic-like serine/threonine-protein kinase